MGKDMTDGLSDDRKRELWTLRCRLRCSSSLFQKLFELLVLLQLTSASAALACGDEAPRNESNPVTLFAVAFFAAWGVLHMVYLLGSFVRTRYGKRAKAARSG
jgi:hypothetical protein